MGLERNPDAAHTHSTVEGNEESLEDTGSTVLVESSLGFSRLEEWSEVRSLQEPLKAPSTISVDLLNEPVSKEKKGKEMNFEIKCESMYRFLLNFLLDYQSLNLIYEIQLHLPFS